ncbi:FBD-associated F-box protein At4g10400-like [Vicia villosa]|uniref:FBD-associated F-box protein At4g10400-like n=1 Tax=Vicia villosa TaxID=3911 RepID=UPI00273BE099|nr:FBD-associated F-box protein At4g10400-like [Vicia villosa]
MSRRRISTAAPAVDNISSLPEVILCHILSFLPTKEAVATSILSKRWTHLWHSVDTINFTDIQIHRSKSNYTFNESVYSVLVSRDAAAAGGSHLISSLCLKISYSNHRLAHLSLPNIIKWINLVVQRKLKHLLLHLDVNDDFDENDGDDADEYFIPKIPASVLTCKTLVSLDLNRFATEDFSDSFIGIEFPSLKTLVLKDIRCLTVREFMVLLFGCPILEYLQLREMCFHGEEDSLSIPEFKSFTLPKLITAHIRNCCCSCFPVKALSNSESLCIETLFLNKKDGIVYQVNQPQCRYEEVTIFHNLTQLKLYDGFNLAPQVLQQCPKLQNLDLYRYESVENEEDDQENWVEPGFVPQCLLSSLITCTIHDLSDLPSDFLLAKYILRNAKILQTMTICSNGEPSEIERKLLSCPKASATCRLLVS